MKKKLAVQHNYSSCFNRYMDTVNALTGKLPALWGTDFILLGTKNPGNEIIK